MLTRPEWWYSFVCCVRRESGHVINNTWGISCWCLALEPKCISYKSFCLCFLRRMLQASWYVKHYEWAYLGGPLSVTLYPIAPLPNKHQLYWESEERRKKSLHLLTGIIFKLLTWTSCGHVIRLYWLHDRLDAEKVVKKIQGHPQEKPICSSFQKRIIYISMYHANENALWYHQL